VADFEALGLHDPARPYAAERVELLEYLVSLGATAEDLLAYRDQLPGLAAVVGLGAKGTLSVAEAAERSGVCAEKLRQIIRAAGFAEPSEDDRAVSESLVALAAGMAAAEAMFGEDSVLQLVRVMGSTMARLADALVSAFLVNVELRVRDEDPVGLEIARANAGAVRLLPLVNAGLDVLLRGHILAARRTIMSDADAGYETQRLCVGFVDLVGSTGLAQRLPIGELGQVLSTFEHLAADHVTAGGGRIVKLIGDEVLYVVSDESAACRIGLELTAAFADHPQVPPVRAGLAGGDVLLRDGDVFGPVVNLAARAVKLAAPSEVLATKAIALTAAVSAEPLPRQQLKGFGDDLELFRITPP
jgi:adenylate cyclase